VGIDATATISSRSRGAAGASFAPRIDGDREAPLTGRDRRSLARERRGNAVRG
jgi:hypothetical protein